MHNQTFAAKTFQKAPFTSNVANLALNAPGAEIFLVALIISCGGHQHKSQTSTFHVKKKTAK
jgi:hypothetical protein